MKTIRNNVFETNSSSCHVITIMTPAEKMMVENRQAMIYCHSRYDDEANIAEVIDFVKYVQQMKKIFGEDYEKYAPFVNELWNNILDSLKKHDNANYSHWDNLCEKYDLGDTDYYDEIEDFMCSCCGEEDNGYCIDNAKEIELCGIKTLISSWEACC